MPQPVSAIYLNKQTARASAALLAAGAWDALPVAMQCPTFEYMTLYMTYTRGGANGAFEIAVEVNEEAAGGTWHRTTVYSPGAVAVNTDTTSSLQAEGIEYGAVTAAAERVIFGPIFLGGTQERIRVFARETGAVATPGTLEIKAEYS